MRKSRSNYQKVILAFVIALVEPKSESSHIMRIPMLRVKGNLPQVREDSFKWKSDTSESYDQLQARRKLRKNKTSLFVPATINPGNYDYNNEGQSWSYRKRIRCQPKVPMKAKADLLITYKYAVETFGNSSIYAILQRLEYDMLMATVSELCGERNVVGLYSSLPVDKIEGVCSPTEALAHYCTVFTGQMKISVESERETADIIDSVRLIIKNGCDQNAFVESASSKDLVKVRYMSPNPFEDTPTATKAEANNSSSVVPYAISGVVIGIILFLMLFLTAWVIRRRQQRRQTANETKADLSEGSDENKFEGPVYGNLGKQFPTQDVHRCMSMLCQQCRQLQQPTFLPTKLQQDNIADRDMKSS